MITSVTQEIGIIFYNDDPVGWSWLWASEHMLLATFPWFYW